MYQQKQQKNTRSENQIIKDPSKIGLLFKKPQLPPIKTYTSSHSKSHNNLQQFTSPKKIKISDIYYQEPEPKKQKYLKNIITEKDSINEGSIHVENQEKEKQQTVMKVHINSTSKVLQQKLCNFHQKKFDIDFQAKENKLSVNAYLKQKDHKNRDCCQTEPSQESSQKNFNSRLKFVHNQYLSLPQTTKNSSQKITPKLKPMKTNFYQKPELFGPVPNKLLPPIDRSQIQRYFISKNQQREIVQKLSKPKCKHESLQIEIFQALNQEKLKQKSLELIHNIERLNKMKGKDCPQGDDEYLEQGLKKKIQENRIFKKKKNFKSFQRFDIEPFDNQKFMKDNFQQNDENYVESKPRQNVFITNNKINDEEESFITGLVTPSKTTLQHDKQTNLKRISEQKDDGFGPRKAKKVQIQVQTQDILILRNEETLNNNSTKTIKPLNLKKSLPDVDGYTLDRKKSIFSQSSAKDFEKIGYTFGSNENSARKTSIIQNQNSSRIQEYYAGKTREEIIKLLSFQRQYWLYYQIEKNMFYDLRKGEYKATQSLKPKISLVSSIFKEDILIKAPKQEEKQTEKPSLAISQTSSIQNIDKLTNIPITIDIKGSKKNQVPETNSSVLTKSRNAPSPNLVKSHINMFNRTPKSIGSSRARRCFRLPKESEYVDFVKNYKPLNPEIKIPVLIQEDNCKVIPSIPKFFFGQIIEESIKHGFGIQITLNEIFEGEYVDGNRKKGYLKVHDGVYEGTFENNLKHGHGIFKWENGQVFEGEWKMGTKNGHGVWTSPDGSYYEGEWHLNMQHGKGKHVHSSGIYEGEFKNFRKEGMGKESFPNGDKFEGEYKNGKPNGKGKYEWSNGTYYEGDFFDGLKQGFGKWHEDANTYYEGEFQRDHKHGQGIEYYKDGSYFEGVFIKGVIQQGKHYNSSKEIIKIIEKEVQ